MIPVGHDPLPKNGRPDNRLKMKGAFRGFPNPQATILFYVNKGAFAPARENQPQHGLVRPGLRGASALYQKDANRIPAAFGRHPHLLSEKSRGRDITPLMAVHADLFGPAARGAGEFMNKDAFCRATGLSRGQVRDLEESGIIIPLEKGSYDPSDVAAGRVLKQCLDAGISMSEARFYPELAGQVVDREMALRKRHTAGLSYEENLALTLTLTRTARTLRHYVIDRIFQHRAIVDGWEIPKTGRNDPATGSFQGKKAAGAISG